MSRWCLLASTVALMSITTTSFGVTLTEDFEDGLNIFDWSFGTGLGGIEDSGGNPGKYYRDSHISSFAPRIRAEPGSPFSGDFRSVGLGSVGIDLIMYRVTSTAEGRPLSLLLIHDNGTPNDIWDDWGASYVGDVNIPTETGVWQSYSFDIPYDYMGDDLPEGWDFVPLGTSSPSSGSWNDLMTDVHRLDFHYGDPLYFFMLQDWDLGFDNVSMTIAVPEPASLAMLGIGALALVRRRR